MQRCHSDPLEQNAEGGHSEAHFGYLYFLRLAALRWSSGMLQEAHECRSCHTFIYNAAMHSGEGIQSCQAYM